MAGTWAATSAGLSQPLLPITALPVGAVPAKVGAAYRRVNAQRANMRHELLGNDIGRALRAVDARWNEVFAHAVSTYGRSLAQGAELQNAVRQVVAAQTKATG